MYGTSNFEEILTHLKSVEFFGGIYGFDVTEVQKDYKKIQDALAKAIVAVHPQNSSLVPDFNKKHCLSVLKDFDDIFTVNYDLLLYWTILCTDEPIFGDYFNRDSQTPDEYCEYFQDGGKSKKHIFFLHGALHLFLRNGNTTKKVWGNIMPLIHQIREEMEKGYYPLVVAEGSADKKKEMIRSNPYLNHAYSSFSQRKGQLFTFGFSFSDPDKHIIDGIINNVGIKYLWIGIRGDFTKPKNQDLYNKTKYMIEERKKIIDMRHIKESKGSGSLLVHFYDTESFDIWGQKSNNIPF